MTTAFERPERRPEFEAERARYCAVASSEDPARQQALLDELVSDPAYWERWTYHEQQILRGISGDILGGLIERDLSPPARNA